MRTTVMAMLLASTVLASAQQQSPVVVANVHVREGTSTYFRPNNESFASAVVGDTSIADAVPLTDRSVLIEAHKLGITNMIFFNADKEPLREVNIIVDRAGGPFIQIHNKALISSYTEYTCWSTGCTYIGESTVSEPAPLPRGYSNSTYSNQGGGPGIQLNAPVDNGGR